MPFTSSTRLTIRELTNNTVAPPEQISNDSDDGDRTPRAQSPDTHPWGSPKERWERTKGSVSGLDLNALGNGGGGHRP